MKTFYVYILASFSRTIYIGVTSDLSRRLDQYRRHLTPGFAEKYNCNRLVYYETFPDAPAAIAREKQLKGWRRDKKTALIESLNPTWQDLSPKMA